MRTKPLLLLPMLLLAASPATAQAGDRQWLPMFGELSGPRFYVTALLDPNSELVVASGKVDRASAEEWCKASGKGDDCVEKVVAEHRAKEARSTADCLNGSMYATDVKQYFMDDAAPAGQATKWKAADGRAVDPDSDWGKALAQQWTIMCPLGKQKVQPQQVARSVPDQPDQPPAAPRAAPAPEPVAGIESSGHGLLDPSQMDGSLWDHNGSEMRIDEQRGTIVYENPKASLSGVARRGTVLFRGRIGYPRPGLRITGTAYAFKAGCTPAEYPVTGRYSADNSEIILQGAGPTWNGCSYNLNGKSKHSTLRFRSMISP